MQFKTNKHVTPYCQEVFEQCYYNYRFDIKAFDRQLIQSTKDEDSYVNPFMVLNCIRAVAPLSQTNFLASRMHWVDEQLLLDYHNKVTEGYSELSLYDMREYAAELYKKVKAKNAQSAKNLHYSI